MLKDDSFGNVEIGYNYDNEDQILRNAHTDVILIGEVDGDNYFGITVEEADFLALKLKEFTEELKSNPTIRLRQLIKSVEDTLDGEEENWAEGALKELVDVIKEMDII